jgi:hypothetical protein
MVACAFSLAILGVTPGSSSLSAAQQKQVSHHGIDDVAGTATGSKVHPDRPPAGSNGLASMGSSKRRV